MKICREHIWFVFQQFFLIPTLTVAENIGLPLIFSGKPYDTAKIDAILGQVGLAHRAGLALRALGRRDAAGGHRPGAGEQSPHSPCG